MKNSRFIRKRASVLTGGLLLVGAALTQGCLQRDIVKQQPNTSNVFVDQVANDAINEIDLLFVIDNSVSMADKQEILEQAVPQMVERLVNPQCIDDDTGMTAPAGPGGDCAPPMVREFSPIDDIHIGVISSSLGGHGSETCPRTDADWDNDDQGRLISTVRPDLPNPNGFGFLEWNGVPDGQDPTAVRNQLVADFRSHVKGTGERGCGFEAPLEAWYRFLVDPQPPQEIVYDLDTKRAIMKPDENGGIDVTVLQQREAFLRPQGLVAIVVLTDENDCSVMDGGTYYNNASFGYLIPKLRKWDSSGAPTSETYTLPISTPTCEENPNHPCCFSCLQRNNAPEACEADKAVCFAPDDMSKPPSVIQKEKDRANSRCYQNKRRFGVDLLYPTQRYVDALSQGVIVDARDGNSADNPLLRGAGINAGQHRPQGLVFFAGIVGIPWQDVATQASLDNPDVMAYRTASELLDENVDNGSGVNVDRWAVILGEPNKAASSKYCEVNATDPACGQAPVVPLDPFMIESLAERTPGATNPISGDQIVDSSSNDPRANNINGHEANHMVVGDKYADNLPLNDDLQYACTFPLTTPKTGCTTEDLSCDCGDEWTEARPSPLRNRPLCQPPGGGPANRDQYFGKAYPGTRILEVLRDFGVNSIVGSICPKISAANSQVSPEDPNYGYNPAVQAIVDRLKEKLGGKCLPRELSTDAEDNSVPCTVVEAKLEGVGDGPLDCTADGRSEVAAKVKPAVLKQLEGLGRCGEGSGFDCSQFEMCAIEELLVVNGVTQGERDECLYTDGDTQSFAKAGFCYIDPAKTVLDSNDEPLPAPDGYPAGGEPPNGGERGTNPLVDGCDATERRLLRFVGKDTPQKNTVTFVACEGDAASADAPIPKPPTASSSGGSGG